MAFIKALDSKEAYKINAAWIENHLIQKNIGSHKDRISKKSNRNIFITLKTKRKESNLMQLTNIICENAQGE